MIPETDAEPAARPRGRLGRLLLVIVAIAAVLVFAISAFGDDGDEDAAPPDSADEIEIPDVAETLAPAAESAVPAIAWGDDDGLVVRFDGSNPTQVEREPTCCVAWSSDGEYLAYRQGDTIIIRRREQATPVTNAPHARMTWSPVAPVLAIAWYDADGPHVDLVDARTGLVTRVADGATDALWSPDGTRLAVGLPQRTEVGPQEALVIYDVDHGTTTGAPRTVPGGPYADVDYGLYFASWSPDGTNVLAWVDEYHSGSGAMDGLDVVAVDVTTGAVRPVGHSLLVRSWFQWSPDGSTFLMVESAGRMVTDPRSVMRCTLDAGCVAVSNYGQTTDPSWSPDGAFFAYVLNDAPTDTRYVRNGEPHWDERYDMRRLWIAEADGERAHQVSDAGDAIAMPRWTDDHTIVYMRGERLWRWDGGVPTPVSATIELTESPVDAVYDPTDVSTTSAWDQRIAIARRTNYTSVGGPQPVPGS